MILHTRLLWFAAGFTVSQRLIVIHPKYRDNLALLAHERCHQAQMERVGTLTFWWLYLTDKTVRKWIEVEAYRVQVAHGASLDYCAHQLATGYNLEIDFDTAKQLLE